MKLIVGSQKGAAGWQTFDIAPGPGVDHVGRCSDLGRFADGAVEMIYASHVLEHVGFTEAQATLKEWFRVLAPGGMVMISVPDLEILSRMLAVPTLTFDQKFEIMKMMFGGQENEHGFHRTGFFPDLLARYVARAGFVQIQRVPSFDLFDDFSRHRYMEIPISLNIRALKPAARFGQGSDPGVRPLAER
jgi:predicted SAM-dependent methyltransferase